MAFFWRRIMLILFVFLIFWASLFVSRNIAGYNFLFNKSFSSHGSISYRGNVTEGVLIERLVISWPDLVESLSKMSSQQQKKFIEQIRRNIVSAAFAEGRSGEDARKLGEAVVMAMLKAISNPSIGNTYF
ncbi:hypothetical protein [Bartonella doshiae]|uniref:Uncharacterized protein n=2 Tax=Bartonella doshiae TaxID=33044 RepID=A0A380ZE22_BARDO|nr:hypothetical protein [Bartonella doshiae]EJF81061.1 hypothetical protein MCS_00774 [Bartonella doshiae NCTC 12862 = ATCC 700133]MBB6159229.1 hypothetical protein [Bartonella doshiae]SUV45209.1 Uncharacterised protein [Bartonella doshiae]